MENQGATIPEVSRILGISENAVLQRVKRGTLPAKRDAYGKWRVSVTSTDPRPTSDQPTNQKGNHTRTVDSEPFPLQTQQESAALIIREAIAPFVERLEKVNQELGQVRAEKEALRLRVLELEAVNNALSAVPDGSEQAIREETQRERDEDKADAQRGAESPNPHFLERLRKLFLGNR